MRLTFYRIGRMFNSAACIGLLVPIVGCAIRARMGCAMRAIRLTTYCCLLRCFSECKRGG